MLSWNGLCSVRLVYIHLIFCGRLIGGGEAYKFFGLMSIHKNLYMYMICYYKYLCICVRVFKSRLIFFLKVFSSPDIFCKLWKTAFYDSHSTWLGIKQTYFYSSILTEKSIPETMSKCFIYIWSILLNQVIKWWWNWCIYAYMHINRVKSYLVYCITGYHVTRI